MTKADAPSDRPLRTAGGMVAPRAQRTVALCVSGSIAAYKSVLLARLLIKAGVRVLPIMTRGAREFVGPSTLSGICSEPVRETMWDPTFAGEMHVDLAKQADVIAIVPATADLLARLAHGRADDLVTALALCAQGPILAAPSMHPRMWEHPATVSNVKALTAQGRIALIGPVDGEVASGERGLGRMAEPEVIVEAILARLHTGDLTGRHIVVSAGPTVEDVDPVRFLSNRSTGKMGFAVAERAARRGAQVSLVTGPVHLATPAGVDRIDVRSALELQSALTDQLANADALIMSAAVGDYRPATMHAEKMKRSGDTLTLELVPNPDVLAAIGAARGDNKRPVLVGFAVETDTDEGIINKARGKLEKKQVDLVVANHAADSFGRDDNRVTLVTRSDAFPLERMSKGDVADRILDRVVSLLGVRKEDS